MYQEVFVGLLKLHVADGGFGIVHELVCTAGKVWEVLEDWNGGQL